MITMQVTDKDVVDFVRFYFVLSKLELGAFSTIN